MVERIRQLLETRQLTPTQFADAIGIARPIVSHVLSGRNKPSLEVVQRILAAMPDLSMPWLLNGTGPMQAGASPTPPLPVEQAPATEPVLPQKPSVESSETAEIAAISSQPHPQPSALKKPAVPQEPSILVDKAASTPRPTIRRFTAPSAKPETKTDANPPAPIAAAAPEAPPAQSPPVVMPSQPDTQANSTPVAPAAAPTEAVEPALSTGIDTAAALFAGSEKPIRRIVIFYRDGSFADYQPE